MEAGWSRMNDLIIIQASQVRFMIIEAIGPPLMHALAQGFCAYVLRHVQNAASRGVVVGHDHRHNSERWAKLTAAAFVERGVKVYLHRGIVLTPL